NHTREDDTRDERREKKGPRLFLRGAGLNRRSQEAIPSQDQQPYLKFESLLPLLQQDPQEQQQQQQEQEQDRQEQELQ
ncbi:hypothetical protein BGX29_003968, partial [Mortierella sp. GBA35]